jgi:hypothetical protein
MEGVADGGVTRGSTHLVRDLNSSRGQSLARVASRPVIEESLLKAAR